MKEFDAAIKELGDKLAELSLKQAVDLKDYLKGPLNAGLPDQPVKVSGHFL